MFLADRCGNGIATPCLGMAKARIFWGGDLDESSFLWVVKQNTEIG